MTPPTDPRAAMAAIEASLLADDALTRMRGQFLDLFVRPEDRELAAITLRNLLCIAYSMGGAAAATDLAERLTRLSR